MRLTYGWLKEYVDCHLPPQELSQRLVMAGLEVSAMEETGEEFRDIITGKIVSMRPHSQAEHLQVCTVDIGRETVPIVCGAPNIAAGDLIPVALPGALLPSGTPVEKAEIRGELSVGMLCSAEELGLMDNAYGILQLNKNLKPGTELAEALDFKDTVLELNITPNRGDCLSVIGIAREVAAITGGRFKPPEFTLKEEGEPAGKWTSVQILEPNLCPRYTARIISDVRIKASPLWMQLRLKAAGMRPLSNIVDITNYVMLELGQPLHAFDYNLLTENRIIVRRAQKGERLVSIDGKARTLDDSMLVIADAKKSVALAGIMGGQESEVSDATRHILLESAQFDPLNNRKTAKKLGMGTEASYRYQRYVDPRGTALAADRAAYFMALFGEGKVHPGLADEWPLKQDVAVITLRISHTNKTLGTSLSSKEITTYLTRLQLKTSPVTEDTLHVEIPSYRSDLTREIDLVEEVARLYGYQKINSTLPGRTAPLENPGTLQAPERLARETLTALSFTEIISYSFIDEEALDKLLVPKDDARRRLVRLKNPLSQDWSCMRTTMLPGLLQTVLFNFNRNRYNLKLFEMGRIYLQSSEAAGEESLPQEPNYLAAALTGLREQSVWAAKKEEVDFFDLKGPLETLLEKLRCRNVKFQRADTPCLHPARAASVLVENEPVGYIGELNSQVLEAFDLSKKVIVFEIDFDKVSRLSQKKPARFQPLPKFPPITRDIALVLNKSVQAAHVADTIRAIAPPILKQIQLFDTYTGEQVPPGEKSLAFSLVFQSEDRTLVNSEVNKFMEELVTHLKETVGAILR